MATCRRGTGKVRFDRLIREFEPPQADQPKPTEEELAALKKAVNDAHDKHEQ